MLFDDLSIFMIVFVWLFVGFYVCMFLVFPRSGANALPQVAKFNDATTALFAMVDLSVLGESVGLDLMTLTYPYMSYPQVIALFIWIGMYYMWIVPRGTIEMPRIEMQVYCFY